MSVIDTIIRKLKDVPWEEKSRAEIEIERRTVIVFKALNPAAVPLLKYFLRQQLIGPGGHAKDELAKRLFNHYLDGGGRPYLLTLQDMKDMNAAGIDVRRRDPQTPNLGWTTVCHAARAGGGPQPYTGHLLWIWDDGAIANYTVNYAGRVTASGTGCRWDGTVDYHDRFDLDPRWGWTPSNPQGRSRGGERRTRIGYILNLGSDFEITSPKAHAFQRDTDSALTIGDAISAGAGPPHRAGDVRGGGVGSHGPGLHHSAGDHR